MSVLALGALQLSAQDLPMPSPTSKLEQRVGLTDFTIEYSRPGVKEREIFGQLVPYGELWRTGANRNTMISFDSPVSIAGELLDPGTYSILTIPEEDHWTIIFNQNTEMWGTGSYSEDQDVLRTEAPVQESDFTETFTISINNIRNESAHLVMEWAGVKVEVPMKVQVREQAMKNIEEALSSEDANKSRVLRNAAAYYYNNDLEMEQALEYINESIDEDDNNWYSHWLKAEILAEMDKYGDAIESAERSIKIGSERAQESGDEFGYEGMIQKNIEDWSEKKGS